MGSKIVETAYIDISESKDANEMIMSLSDNIESGEFDEKKIILNLGEVELNQAQLMGMKSLVENVNSMIDFIHSASSKTKLSALTAGVSIANQKDGEYEKEQCEVISAERDMLLDELMPKSNQGLHKRLQDEVVSDEVMSKMQYVEMEPMLEVLDEEDVEETAEHEMELKEEMETTVEDVVDMASDNREFVLTEEQMGSGETAYITQTLRSGQVVSYDGNVVIIGDAHCGSEIVASGDITVWGVLSGIAHAGAFGNEKSKIRALKIDAIQLRIAKYFARRPDRANIEFVEKTSTFTPEEARVEDGGIFIYTMNS